MTRYEAYVTKHWKEDGMANILVVRLRPDRPTELGIFLADLFCLGVKEALYYPDLTDSQFREFLADQVPESTRLSLHPACAKKMIEGAVAYAEKFGFAPHRDYRKARRVLSGVDSADCPETYAYGDKDGRSCYIRGPHDSDERVDRVLSILEQKCGIGGFSFVDPEEDAADDEPYARDDLMGWLEDQPESVPLFHEFSGLITGMQLCPKILTPADLVNVLWADKSGPPGLDEVQELMPLLAPYWNSVTELIEATVDPAAEEDETCMDIRADDFAEDDRDGPILAVWHWTQGFNRALKQWPDAWSEPLRRPALAPHWKLVRSFAEIELPGSAEKLASILTENSRPNIGRSIATIARALRGAPPR